MHLSASLPIAIVLMLKRSCLLAYVGNRCLRGRRANEVSLCSYPLEPASSSVNTLWTLPIAGETSIKPNPFVPFDLEWKRKTWSVFWSCQRRAFGQSFSTGHVHLSDSCFLDQLLGFPDCWISLNWSLIFVWDQRLLGMSWGTSFKRSCVCFEFVQLDHLKFPSLYLFSRFFCLSHGRRGCGTSEPRGYRSCCAYSTWRDTSGHKWGGCYGGRPSELSSSHAGGSSVEEGGGASDLVGRSGGVRWSHFFGQAAIEGYDQPAQFVSISFSLMRHL